MVNDTSAPLPRGFLRRSIAEQKRQEVEQYLTGLRSLLDQYRLSTAGKVLDFMSQAVTTGPGRERDDGHDRLQRRCPGDSLTIWTLAATKQTRKVQATPSTRERGGGNATVQYAADRPELHGLWQKRPYRPSR